MKLLGWGAAGAAGYTAVKNWEAIGNFLISPPSFEEYPVDQVFRDYGDNGGYRIIFTDGEDAQVREKFFKLERGGGLLSNNRILSKSYVEKMTTKLKDKDFFIGFKPKIKENINIYKDLEAGKRGYARVLKDGFAYTYVEIHLPSNANLRPGHSQKTAMAGKGIIAENDAPLIEIK